MPIVPGMVGYMRRNFLVPVPSFESFEALNAHLERRCLARMDARLRGHSESMPTTISAYAGWRPSTTATPTLPASPAPSPPHSS